MPSPAGAARAAFAGVSNEELVLVFCVLDHIRRTLAAPMEKRAS